MTTDGESVESLKARLQEMKAEVEKRAGIIAQLEKANRNLSGQVQDARETGQSPAEISEIEKTLSRVLKQMATIVQGSKCLFMTLDRDGHELYADTPAIGYEKEDVEKIRVRVDRGISGEVFRTGESVILYDSQTDSRAAEENWAGFGVDNGVCAPLIIEKRDDETNQVIERKTVGVVWVQNKRFGNIFIDEDIKLLERIARNAAAVINSAETFRQVVKERDEAVETIQALSMGLLMVNRNRRVTQMNSSAMKIFGITRSELTGDKSLDAVVKDEEVRTLLTRALTEDAEVQDEISIPDTQHPDQVRTFQIQSAQVRNDSSDVIGTATIFNDITDIKNIDKMKTAFVSTVSHELRTPLTSIKGFISTLVQDTEGFYDNETRHEFYTIIDTECDRLRRLIDDLLNVSRIESGATLEMNAMPFNIRETLDKVVTIQNGSTYKRPNHTLTWNLAENVPTELEADQDKIEQVFHNLVGNALKYAPGGGPVTVSGRLLPDGETIEFAIADKGMGMSDTFLKKVGEKFARADNRDTRSIGGTGIGLFLVKAFVEGHGGKMWPASEGEGKGSTFFFTLPLKQPEEGGPTHLSGAVSA